MQRSTSASMIDYLRMGCVQGHMTSLNFGKNDNISKTVQDRDVVAMEDQ